MMKVLPCIILSLYKVFPCMKPKWLLFFISNQGKQGFNLLCTCTTSRNGKLKTPERTENLGVAN
jgi:hypothetical protein